MLLNCFYCLVLSSFVVCYKQFSDGKIIALNIGEGLSLIDFRMQRVMMTLVGEGLLLMTF